jgi:hypothetical protein
LSSKAHFQRLTQLGGLLLVPLLAWHHALSNLLGMVQVCCWVFLVSTVFLSVE